MRSLVNGLVWGSSEGPAIVVNWEKQTVDLNRMPTWAARRVLRWLAQGEREKT